MWSSFSELLYLVSLNTTYENYSHTPRDREGTQFSKNVGKKRNN